MTHADDLQRIIDSQSVKMSENFLTWVESTLSATDWDLFEAALDAGDFNQASRMIKWQEYAPDAVLGDALGAAATVNSEYISDLTGTKFRFDLKDPNALAWIESHGAELVTQVSDPTKAAIREVVYRGYFEGYTTKQQAQFIRGMVGLTEQQIAANENYARRLFKKGLSPEDVSKKANRYAEKQLRRRSQTIAVNETSVAATQGQYLSTRDACNRGVIDTHRWEGYRITAGDERVCPICSAVAGERRSLPDGVYQSNGSQTTHSHVLCRCVEGIREISTKSKEARHMDAQIEESVESSMELIFEAKLKETEESIFINTIPIVEGVFEGRGFPALRLYDEFNESARWLNGLPVMINHEEMTPEARLVGQLGSVTKDGAKKRIKAVTEFIKKDLTPRELESIKSKKPIHGSLTYRVNIEHTQGEWNGKRYEAIERGPYVFREYSVVRNGVVTPEDGGGFNIEASPKFTDKTWNGAASKYKDTDAYCAACLIDYNEQGKKKVQSKCKLPVREPDGTYNKGAIRNALARISQMKGVPSADLATAKKKLETLAKQAKIGSSGESKSRSPAHRAVTKPRGGKHMTGDDLTGNYEPDVREDFISLENRIETLESDFKVVKEENKQLKETIAEKEKSERFRMFSEKLKPGHQTEAETLFEEYMKDPAGWTLENIDKFVKKIEEQGLKGSAVIDAKETTEAAETHQKNMKDIYEGGE